MSLRDDRAKRSDEVTKGIYIAKVLKAQGQEIDSSIQKVMDAAGFQSDFWRDRSMTVAGTKLEYRHLKVHRFHDMPTRQTKSGKIRKKRNAIHDRIIYGHLNDIARELSIGYTDAVIAEIRKLETINYSSK